jgi:predicted O-methyltransferase YrrM
VDWSFYETAKDLLNQGKPRDALERLEQYRLEHGQLAPPLAVLQAEALIGLGQARAAGDALLDVIARGEADFWVFYNLADARRHLGDWPGVFEASRHAHALAGWPESRSHGYRFTHDYFSANLLAWHDWFERHIRAAPLRALEIGSWQGGSACWLLDQVIGPRGGSLTCVDPFEGSSEHADFLPGLLARLGVTLEGLFDDNILRTGRADLLDKRVGYSQDVLPRLYGEKFDFVYIDGAHEAKFVIQDAVLCWQLLASGGVMLFDDVPSTFATHPEQNTARAIDFFLSVFAEDIEVLERGRQLLLRRRG